jgi:hypothetical protein
MFDLESTIEAAMGDAARAVMTALRRRRREFSDDLQMKLAAVRRVARLTKDSSGCGPRLRGAV